MIIRTVTLNNRFPLFCPTRLLYDKNRRILTSVKSSSSPLNHQRHYSSPSTVSHRSPLSLSNPNLLDTSCTPHSLLSSSFDLDGVCRTESDYFKSSVKSRSSPHLKVSSSTSESTSAAALVAATDYRYQAYKFAKSSVLSSGASPFSHHRHHNQHGNDGNGNSARNGMPIPINNNGGGNGSMAQVDNNSSSNDEEDVQDNCDVLCPLSCDTNANGATQPSLEHHSSSTSTSSGDTSNGQNGRAKPSPPQPRTLGKWAQVSSELQNNRLFVSILTRPFTHTDTMIHFPVFST